MITHHITRTYTGSDGTGLTLVEAPTGNDEGNFSQSVPIAANTQYHLAFTRANLKSLTIRAAGNVSIFTNAASGSSPTDTIAVTATTPRIWTLAGDGLAACPFSADVTTIYITNATAGAVQVEIRALLAQ